MDLSKLSDADLLALKAGDLSKVSDAGLMSLKGVEITAPKQMPSSLESAIVGGGKGVLDPALALAEYAGGKYAEISQNIQQRMKPFQEANPTAFGAGQLGGGLLTGGALMKGVGMIPSFAKANPYLQAAIVGSATGVLTPSNKSQEQAMQDIPQKLGVGALGGVGGTAIGQGIGNVVSPRISEAVKKLVGEGVNVTPGQALGGMFKTIEDKATSLPIIGDAINYARQKGIEEFNKATYKKALESIGGKTPESTGREGIAAVKGQIDNAYDQLLPKLSFNPDKILYDSLKNLDKTVQGLSKEDANTVAINVANLIQNRLPKQGGSSGIDGNTFKMIETDLSQLASDYAGAIGSQATIGRAYKQALADLRVALGRNNPDYAQELANINTAFAHYARLRKAGSMANTQETFTPSQLANAVKQADQSAGKGATATGKALMQDLSDAGVQVLPSKTPDSGTAGRMILNSLAGGVAGGAALSNPTAAALASTLMIPYLPGGRQLTTAMLAKRPEIAQKLADAIRKSSPYLAAPAAQNLTGEQ
jgi:hypothetical protein